MREDTQLDLTARVRRALRLAQASVADEARSPASPDELASAAHLSKYHFSRLFSAMVGESPGAHVRRLRLERAAGELSRTDDQIIRIALRAGYEAHEPFSRAFKKHFGETPSAYRASHTGRHTLVFPPTRSGVHYGPDTAIDRFTPITHPEIGAMQVEVRDVPARRLAAVRHIGPYHEIGGAFERIFKWAASQGPLMGPMETVGLYHDDPDATPPEQLRSDACIACGPAFHGDEDAGVSVIELPAGKAAVAIHEGPYAELPTSWRWFYGEWLAKSGHTPRDTPCCEVYLNDPTNTKPEDLRTEMHIPLM